MNDSKHDVAGRLAEALDNTAASLETMLAHFGKDTPAEDNANRERVLAEARKALAEYRAPQDPPPIDGTSLFPGPLYFAGQTITQVDVPDGYAMDGKALAEGRIAFVPRPKPAAPAGGGDFPGHELRPEDFTREQLVAALGCVHMLADDYARGEIRDGMDWEDIDATADAAFVSFPGIRESALRFVARRQYDEEVTADTFEEWCEDNGINLEAAAGELAGAH